MSHFDNTLGALLMSLMVSLTLYGITLVQTYMYYTTYSDDRRHIKCLVLSLLLLDTLESIFISHAVYVLLVSRYGEPAGLMHAFENTWTISGSILVTCLIAFLAQAFLAHRVWMLSGKNWILTGVIALFSLVQIAFTLIVGVMCILDKTLFVKLNQMKWMLLVPYSCAAVCDTVISASLCWFLYWTPTYFERTQLLINKLILYTVNTSLWTTTCVLLDLILFLVWPSNLIYVGVFFWLSKLYTNSLLGILNTRKNLRSTMHTTFDIIDLGSTFPVSGCTIPRIVVNPSTATTTTTAENSVIRLPGTGRDATQSCDCRGRQSDLADEKGV